MFIDDRLRRKVLGDFSNTGKVLRMGDFRRIDLIIIFVFPYPCATRRKDFAFRETYYSFAVSFQDTMKERRITYRLSDRRLSCLDFSFFFSYTFLPIPLICRGGSRNAKLLA